MKKNNYLREIKGEKIRFQYFTWPILIIIFCMFLVPYCMLVFSLLEDKFDLSQWISFVLVSIRIYFFFLIPLIALYILNRQFFGKIICVINENGIYHNDGLLKWGEIVRIKYEIEFPSRTGYRFCHAFIYTNNENIVLVHAPMSILSKSRKYNPNINASVSKNSKWMIALFIVVLVVAVPIIPFFR